MGDHHQAAKIEGDCVFISWLWCEEYLRRTLRTEGKPVRSAGLGKIAYGFLPSEEVESTGLGVWLDSSELKEQGGVSKKAKSLA